VLMESPWTSIWIRSKVEAAYNEFFDKASNVRQEISMLFLLETNWRLCERILVFVKVNTWAQLCEGGTTFCTVPLGFFKSGSIRFILDFPQQKLDAIKRLGIGLLNKVAMLFRLCIETPLLISLFMVF
ncbi:hypothetical protein EJD97_021072, partial [Solanum chilense]